MTLGQLLSITRAFVGEKAQGKGDGDLVELLNQAQREASRTLRTPQRYANVFNVDAPFGLPVEAGELLHAEFLTLDTGGSAIQSTTIPIYTLMAAERFDPQWAQTESADVADYLIWDPTNVTAPILPVPPPDATHLQSFRLLYVIRPPDMVNLTDLPLQGNLPTFHIALAHYAAFLLTGEQLALQQYQYQLGLAYAAARRPATPLVNPMFPLGRVLHG